ncbi:MAG: WXG100 family type VII secretion target [Chloroflexus sp.]|jgi:WXG100 family type VII secretion target|nr:WXG100 family type VII secretion target [Chloroflexus sp.]
MPLISIDTDQARATASTFDSSHSSIESALRNMVSAVDAALAVWQGASSQQFANEWNDWRTNLNEMLQLLQGLANGIRREVDEFEAVDRSFISA